jgi:hypothetical protein
MWIFGFSENKGWHSVRVDYSESAADSGFMNMIYGICFRGYWYIQVVLC